MCYKKLSGFDFAVTMYKLLQIKGVLCSFEKQF